MSTDKKTIKSYDDYAKKWADKLRSGQNLAHKYLEKPAMYSKLPDLKGKSVICIGCGTGEECEHLKTLGADRVVGIDISQGLIEVAKKSFPQIEFQIMDMEEITLPEFSFDFAYSSLTLHYVEDWTKTLKSIYKVLKPGGVLLFSTHHPVKWSADVKRGDEKDTFLLGYTKFKQKDDCEVYGDYLNTRKINDVWFGDFEVSYYHKPLSSIFKNILDSGFQITDFLEPKAVEEAKTEKVNFWKIHQKIPLFMIFELRKI
ncbi:MAG: class I SAM-dependent methyltransferase [Patescibacteria group bacterium]|nr:class I SAM-dependent methyltransferase [Patescibacteria group bacterium]